MLNHFAYLHVPDVLNELLYAVTVTVGNDIAPDYARQSAARNPADGLPKNTRKLPEAG